MKRAAGGSWSEIRRNDELHEMREESLPAKFGLGNSASTMKESPHDEDGAVTGLLQSLITRLHTQIAACRAITTRPQ